MNFTPPPPRIYRHLTGMLQFGILCFLCICTCTDFLEILSIFLNNAAVCNMSPLQKGITYSLFLLFVFSTCRTNIKFLIKKRKKYIAPVCHIIPIELEGLLTVVSGQNSNRNLLLMQHKF